MNDYLTYRMNLKNGIVSKPVKEKKPLNPRSDKMKEEMALYKPEAIKFLSRPENKYCKLKFDGCQKLANCIQHVRGRLSVQLHNQKDWLPSCGWCNSVCESKAAEAKSKGVAKSKLSIEQ